MAQATLVSLALASAAGSVGERWDRCDDSTRDDPSPWAAYHRQSGNLASLGIAASHLWIGLHAIQSNPSKSGSQNSPLGRPHAFVPTALAVTCIKGRWRHVSQSVRTGSVRASL
ncbi:MAG: hypothetical protein Ct9H90mP16_13840 [Candidatus Poseidoniales archaeon]|nr:MAG: hypothetical protein Ct9H90mP16_13840 [Candidatus Poseidoniales archaeon]